MYAVIELGAKQYKVEKGDIIDVEKQGVEIGKEIAVDKILMVSKNNKVEIGHPFVKDAKVSVVVLGEVKADKIVSFKYRRRKSSHWTKGTRQQLTRLKINDIVLG